MNYGLFIKFYHRFRPLRPAASSLLHSCLIGPHQPATFSPLILRVASAHSTSVHMPGMAQPFAWNTTQTFCSSINIHTVRVITSITCSLRLPHFAHHPSFRDYWLHSSPNSPAYPLLPTITLTTGTPRHPPIVTPPFISCLWERSDSTRLWPVFSPTRLSHVLTLIYRHTSVLSTSIHHWERNDGY
jgi:hypothetical protein